MSIADRALNRRGGGDGETRRRVRAIGVYTPCGKVGVRENKTALKRGLEGGEGGGMGGVCLHLVGRDVEGVDFVVDVLQHAALVGPIGERLDIVAQSSQFAGEGS